jgi:hypothetical protein
MTPGPTPSGARIGHVRRRQRDLHPKVKPAQPDVFVIRRETFNYIVIAVTFLLRVALGW